MLPATAAEAIILRWAQALTLPPETVPLDQVIGRILAVDLTSPVDFPHWDNSAMDGYAVRHGDVAEASAEHPVSLTVVEEIPAGRAPQQGIQPGQAARILTGSMVPAGADTVVMQEHTQRQGDRVQVLSAPKPGQFVRARGTYAAEGDPLLAAGTVLGAAEVAVLAAAQMPQVPVRPRPRVAVLSTGDELVTPDQPLQPGQIVDSNQYALAALAQQAGALPLNLGIVADQPSVLRRTIQTALEQADVVVSTGGVSVGDYDYVDATLAELGGKLLIRSVAVKPGKPLTVAVFPQASGAAKLYFGLPGNPASAMVGFWRFIAPALRQLQGLAPELGWVQATTHSPLRADGQRETYLWGRLSRGPAGYGFAIAPGRHLSGNLINLAGTNALAVVPVGTTDLPAGSPVQVLAVGAADTV